MLLYLLIEWVLFIITDQVNEALELCGTDDEKPAFLLDQAVLDHLVGPKRNGE